MEGKSNRKMTIARKPIFSHNRGPNQYGLSKDMRKTNSAVTRYTWPAMLFYVPGTTTPAGPSLFISFQLLSCFMIQSRVQANGNVSHLYAKY